MFQKIFRYAFISFVKFTVALFGLFSVYVYLLPDWVSGNVLVGITWLAVFLIAFLFAEWAFHPAAPMNKDIVLLVVVWFSVTITMMLGYGILFSPRGPAIVATWEILGQFVFELAAILLAGYATRRRKLKQYLGG